VKRPIINTCRRELISPSQAQSKDQITIHGKIFEMMQHNRPFYAIFSLLAAQSVYDRAAVLIRAGSCIIDKTEASIDVTLSR
jgi:hypothetical protein